MATWKGKARVMAHVDPDVLKVFKRMAQISGLSLARTIGEWLAQTADGATVVTKMYATAKGAPSKVLSDMHARAHLYQDHIDEAAQDKPPAPPAARPVRAVVRPIRPGVPSPRPVTRGESPPHSRPSK